MIAVYLAGPITKGNQFVNVRAAVLDGARLRANGFAVFVPHRSALDEMVAGETHYEVWMAEDFEWIARCDALVRMPGESPGADREVEHARSLGKPVFFGVDEFLRSVEAAPLVESARPSGEALALLQRSACIIAGRPVLPPPPADPYGIEERKARRSAK